jgi:hypothetical protein
LRIWLTFKPKEEYLKYGLLAKKATPSRFSTVFIRIVVSPPTGILVNLASAKFYTKPGRVVSGEKVQVF